MITFELSEEQSMIRDSLRGFAADVLAPAARAIDESGEMPAEVIRQGWDFGLIAASIPEIYGGGGGERSCMTNAVALEALGGGCASQAVAIMAPGQFVGALLDFGTEDQKAEHLPRFAGSDPVAAAVAIQESQFGFAAGAPRTTATRKGNGWVLNGEKRLVPLGDRADTFLVLAAEPENGGAVSAFIVPRDTAGLTVSAESGTQGLKPVPRGESGSRPSNCPARPASAATPASTPPGWSTRPGSARRRSPSACRARPPTSPFPTPESASPSASRSARSSRSPSCWPTCTSSAKSMRWMVWKAASLLEHNDPGAAKAAVLAQDYVRRKAVKIADDALQIFGGHGFIRDLPLEMWLRNARTLTVLDGPVSV